MQGLALRIAFSMAQFERQMDDVVLSTLDRDDVLSIPFKSATTSRPMTPTYDTKLEQRRLVLALT
jgi:hypothetical protein